MKLSERIKQQIIDGTVLLLPLIKDIEALEARCEAAEANLELTRFALIKVQEDNDCWQRSFTVVGHAGLGE